MPMRPTCRRFEWPAIPTTSVANNSGAIMVLIKRRKIWLSSRAERPISGQSWPISAPNAIETRIQVVSERRRQAYNTNPTSPTQRPMNPRSGWCAIQPMAATSAPAAMSSTASRSGPPARGDEGVPAESVIGGPRRYC